MIVIHWQRRERLAVDYDGRLWLDLDEPPWWRPLGWIVDEPDVPEDLVGERAELLDLWRDSTRGDARAERWAEYYAGLF